MTHYLRYALAIATAHLLLLAALAGCRAQRELTPTAGPVLTAADSAGYGYPLPGLTPVLAPPVVEPPAGLFPGLLPGKEQHADSQGSVGRQPVPNHAQPVPGPRWSILRPFSTPEGTARRQAVRLARAAGPRKLGKGAVYAVNSDVVSAYKPAAAVVRADSGAVVSTIGKNKAPAATGTGATATSTTTKPGFWGAVAAAFNWWWLLLPAGYVAYRLWRKTVPFA